MTTSIKTRTDWVALARQLGIEFAPRAAAHDADDSFVAENFDILKQHSIFAAGVPQELGGGGAAHAELAAFLHRVSPPLWLNRIGLVHAYTRDSAPLTCH